MDASNFRKLSTIATKHEFQRQTAFMKFFEEAADVIVDTRKVCQNFILNDVFGCMDRMEDFVPKLIDNFCEESLERIWCHRGARRVFELRLSDVTVAQARMLMCVLDVFKKTELEDDALHDVKTVYMLLVLVRDLRHHQLLKAGGKGDGKDAKEEQDKEKVGAVTPTKKESGEEEGSSPPASRSRKYRRRHQRIMQQVK